MNKYLLRAVNSFLLRFRTASSEIKLDSFSMQSSIERIAEHKISVKSIIDIGASNGIWSKTAMKTFPSASFLAIEPLLERESALKNLKQNQSNFDYILCAGGEIDGQQAILNVTDDLDGSTINGRNGSQQRKVTVKTIDAILSKKNMRGPFLLKFDTHGYEVPILKGARETLKNTNIIIMEVYNFKFTENALKFYEMCGYLEKLGFSCYDIAEPMLRFYDKAFWQMDLFFCRSDSAIFTYSQYK